MPFHPRGRSGAAKLLLAGSCLVFLGSSAELGKAETSILSATPREAIGWRLFFDPRLSRTRTYSCASCHQPEKGYADGLPRAVGAYGDTLRRHTPRITNLAGARAFFWDGRAASLEEQALVPLTHPQEMDLTPAEIVARVAESAEYPLAFAALGTPEPQIDDIVGALASFVGSLRTGPAPFDRWLQGEGKALDEAQKRGRMFFFTRGQCATCHIGSDLTDHDFHDIGTGTEADPGRFEVTGDPEDRGRFKTPSLRNWQGSAPFFHDGRLASIEEVFEHYAAPPENPVGRSELDPLDLSAEERSDLLAFLEALNGPAPDLTRYEEGWESLIAPQ